MTVNDVRFPYEGASLPIDTQYEEVRSGFNKSVLTGLLCDQLGFDETVCTDWGLDHRQRGDASESLGC